MKRNKASNELNQELQNAPPGQAGPLGIAGRSDALQRRPEASPAKVATKVTRTPGGAINVEVPKSLAAMLKDGLCLYAGTRNDEVAARILEQVGNSLHGSKSKDADSILIQALSSIREMEPQNLTEAMLATQTIATHEAAIFCIQAGIRTGQTLEACNLYMAWATRLMRLHLDQIEAMQKLKGKAGQQKVIVEHVHVHRGGQAIVGAVNAAKTEPGEGVIVKAEPRPYGQRANADENREE